MKKKISVALIVFCMVTLLAVPVTQAFNLGDILKVGGVAYLVDRFANPLNDFINKLTFKHGVGNEFATKVVPIITVGSGSYIGAVQVIGPEELVDQTEAVVQIEGNFSGNQFRVKALIPIDSKNPVNFSRVNGVGVSAIIDVKI